MGVKDLWTVLEPVGERVTMADLQGKRLAVDISGWIFQSLQSPVFMKKPTLRPHLRNLFWRLHHLMRHNVRVLVVFDGPSPKLKGVALANRAVARRQQREKDQPVEEESVDELAVACGTVATGFRTTNAVENTYFAQLCAECKEMLRVFRIPYIVSSGDAESTCAYLNRLGCVDGCITDDNDAFLFGAFVVYRHYTCDKKRLENLRCYESQVIADQLGLTQDHLIAMALILGCDYGLSGIKGVGKERALDVLQSWPGCDPLEKLRQWRTDVDLATLTKFDPAAKPEHCRNCGHLGNMFDHKSDGCNGCAREGRMCTRINAEDWTCSCEWHRKHAEFKSKQVEIKIMKAAVEDANFPDEDIIDIYKQPYPESEGLGPGTFHWTRPLFGEMQKFMSRLFGWPRDKTREKIITYLTAFDLCAVIYGDLQYHHCAQPEKIIAKRVENGREMYEIQWRTIPDVPVPENDAAAREVITKELKDVFTGVFPEMAAEFEEMKKVAKQKQGKSKSKRRKADDGADAEETNSSEPKKKKKQAKKKSLKSDKTENEDENVDNNEEHENEDSYLEEPNSPAPKKKRKPAKKKLKKSDKAANEDGNADNNEEQENEHSSVEEPSSPPLKKKRKPAKKKLKKSDKAANEDGNGDKYEEQENEDSCLEEPNSPAPKKKRKPAKMKLRKGNKAVSESGNADVNGVHENEDFSTEKPSSPLPKSKSQKSEEATSYLLSDSENEDFSTEKPSSPLLKNNSQKSDEETSYLLIDSENDDFYTEKPSSPSPKNKSLQSDEEIYLLSDSDIEDFSIQEPTSPSPKSKSQKSEEEISYLLSYSENENTDNNTELNI